MPEPARDPLLEPYVEGGDWQNRESIPMEDIPKLLESQARHTLQQAAKWLRDAADMPWPNLHQSHAYIEVARMIEHLLEAPHDAT